jgi:hypothetical protein
MPLASGSVVFVGRNGVQPGTAYHRKTLAIKSFVGGSFGLKLSDVAVNF